MDYVVQHEMNLDIDDNLVFFELVDSTLIVFG